MARTVTLLSLPWNGPGDPSGNIDGALALLRQQLDPAAGPAPDLVLLPEALNIHNLPPEQWAKAAETIPGPATRELAQALEDSPALVVFPLFEKGEGVFHNTAPLLLADEDIAGLYRKRYLLADEQHAGAVPGVGPCVFETPLGRMGVAICFDVNFDPLRPLLAEGRPELVLFPSMFNGGRLLESLAVRLCCYVLSATSTGEARLIDPLGRTASRNNTSGEPLRVELNLDYAVVHLDHNGERLGELERQHEGVEVVRDTDIGRALVVNNNPDTRLADLLAANGMETCLEYLARLERENHGRSTV